MSQKPLDPKLYAELVKAEADFESGRMSRRDFHKLLLKLGAITGVTVAELNPVHAWVATHMRKRAGSSSSGSVSAKSLRFNRSGSATLSRTFTAPTNQYIWTFSTWIKREVFSGSTYFDIFSSQTNTGTYYIDIMHWNDSFSFQYGVAGSWGNNYSEIPVRRDPAAWYHLVVACDLTQVTGSDRVKIYVNGALQPMTGTPPAQNTNYNFNTNAKLHSLMAEYNGSVFSGFNDGYLFETYFIDGQALTASGFGQNDATTGEWNPKIYSGTFGNNGFYLPYKSASAVNGSGTSSGSYPNVTGVAGLGADFSGNGNHFTGSGLTVDDQVRDTPVTNYAVLAANKGGLSGTLSSAGLVWTTATGTYPASLHATMAVSSGKWYWEVIADGASPANGYCVGVVASEDAYKSIDGNVGSQTNAVWDSRGNTYLNAVSTAASTFTTGDVIGVALDADSLQMTFYKNGTSTATISGMTAGKDWFPICHDHTAVAAPRYTFNFGQGGQSGLTFDSASGGSFKYTPPSGYKALCTANLASPAITRPSQYFGIANYTGNGGTQRVGTPIAPTSSYTVAKSLRFQKANSAYLSRTFGSGSGTTWTFSFWIKRSVLYAQNNYQCVFTTAGSGAQGSIWYGVTNSSDQLSLVFNGYSRRLSALYFQDVSSWCHVVVAVDTTQASEANRATFYVNGVIASTTTPTAITQNDSTQINTAVGHLIGNQTGQPYGLIDAYLTEVNFIDGAALTPASFGQTDAASGEWVPKQYGGTYGTNGFYLNFSDNSNTTAATLGKDWSGNGNNWTPSGFTVNDFVIDTPTKNFATLNPLRNWWAGGSVALSAGNLTAIDGGTSYGSVPGTIEMSSGKWYWEVTCVSSGGSYGLVGVKQASESATYPGGSSFSYAYQTDGQKFNASTGSSYGATFTTSDVIGVKFDADYGRLEFLKNGVSQGIAYSSLPAAAYLPVVGDQANASSYTWTINFGQGGQSGLTYDSASGGAFKYTPPSGYKALCGPNFSTSFSSSSALTGTDLVMIKGRSSGTDTSIYDSTRGAFADLAGNSIAAETSQASGLISFAKNGFTVGSLAKLNTAGNTYSAWMWKKSAAAGLDIVTWAGNGAASRQISHTLGVKPSMILQKGRGDGTYHWNSWHKGLDAGYYIPFNVTSAPDNSLDVFPVSGITSSYFTTSAGSPYVNNQSGIQHIAYVFAEVAGYSRFGLYTGNGSTGGPFNWCGFRPRWIMIRRIDSADDWIIYDTQRDTYNQMDKYLRQNLTSAEGSGTASYVIDAVSNGFVPRGSASSFNASGGTYIYAAFAEMPFKYANAR